ncbi:relaxase domain-containing protein [Frankia sp. AgB1.8]|uniref:relaxase domain-containing protein n=1 Tax=Frankia sp. AgB1.8 TaxID=2792839 RepID=UPI0035A84C2F
MPATVLGFDVVCAAPKSVSLLWAFGDERASRRGPAPGVSQAGPKPHRRRRHAPSLDADVSAYGPRPPRRHAPPLASLIPAGRSLP